LKSLPVTQITDARLKYLEGVTKLKVLLLRGIQVTDAGVAELQDIPLLNKAATA